MKSIESILKHFRHRRALQLITGIFVLLMMWDIISSIRLFPSLEKAFQKKMDEGSQMQEQAASASADEIAINKSLFGAYLPKNIDAAGIRESLSNFTVAGVLFSENENDSKVLLQKQDGQEQFYGVGDKLSDGSIIKRISPEGVLLLRAGELERLGLPKEELRFQNNDKPLPVEDGL